MKNRFLGKLGNGLFYSILISSIVIVLLSIISAIIIRQALNENIRCQRALDSIGDTIGFVNQSLIDQETGLRGYIITKDPSFLTPYNKGKENFDTYSKLLIKTSKNYNKIIKEVNEFIQNGKRWQKDYAQKSFDKVHGEQTPPVQFMYEGKNISDEFRNHAITLTKLIEDERTVVRNTMQKRINITLISLVFITLILMVLNVLFYYNKLKAILNPLIRLSKCVEAYANNHFTIQVPDYHKKDELKDLINNIDSMREKLSENIGNLKTRAITDELTKLYNRRYFNEIYSEIWEKAKQKNVPISFILFDIDQYKLYNDTYGHLKGDECLKKISTFLNTLNEPPNKYVARFGGEEFVLLALNEDETSAYVLAENIRKKIHDLNIPHKGSKVDDVVTISVGVVTVFPSDKIKPESVILQADKALYLSKKNGRNQVTKLHI